MQISEGEETHLALCLSGVYDTWGPHDRDATLFKPVNAAWATAAGQRGHAADQAPSRRAAPSPGQERGSVHSPRPPLSLSFSSPHSLPLLAESAAIARAP